VIIRASVAPWPRAPPEIKIVLPVNLTMAFFLLVLEMILAEPSGGG